jgi:hypothetical protein
MFDLDFDLSWRSASGLWGRGRGVAFSLASVASFPPLSFRSFGLGVHLRVICSVDFTWLRSRWLPSVIPGERLYLTSLFDNVQTIDGCDSSCYFFAGVAIAVFS